MMMSPAVSGENIQSPPPVELLLLPNKMVFSGNKTTGSHGHESYCFEINDTFVVYSKNAFGEGYAFYLKRPKNSECSKPDHPVSTRNNMGLGIGSTKGEAERALGIVLKEGENRITWSYQRPIHNIPYDDYTYLNITIFEGKIIEFNIHNTVSS